MTGWAQPISGASSTRSCSWKNIEWENVELNVHRLQMRIAKAIRKNRHGKAKSLQWLLTHSLISCQAYGGETSCTKSW